MSLAVGLAAVLAWVEHSAAQAQIDLIPLATAVWRFDDTNADRGTAWRGVNYPEEATWRTGVAMFGVEPTVPYPYPAPVTTPLVLGANRLTYYFRTHFQVASPPSSLVVEASAYVDDGAVFYVNGIEVGRVRVPDNPANHTSRAELAYPEGLAHTWTVPTSALVQGDNVFAVEVHQNSSSSSDVLFGLGLRATGATIPTILTANEPSDRTVRQGSTTTFTVQGAGIPAPAYQWYHEGVPLQNGGRLTGATTPSLTITDFMGIDAGTYYVVLSNFAGAATSRVAQVMYEADLIPPTVLYAILRDTETVDLVFSEPIQADYLSDSANWEILPAGGGAAVELDGTSFPTLTNLSLSTRADLGHVLSLTESYVVKVVFPVPDLVGNVIPADTLIPVASFPAPLVSLTNQSWRYENSGTDLGATWAQTAFNDGGWLIGTNLFDVFRAFPTSAPVCRVQTPLVPDLVATCLPSLSNAQNTAQLSAVYFRTHFNFPGNQPTNSVLRLRALIDDGAVIYLNGVELFRPGMPAGMVSYATLANRAVGNPLYETFEFATSALVEGDNVLAVEVHQDTLISDDLTFGLDLTGTLPAPPPQQQANAAAPRLNAVAREDNIDLAWSPSAGRLQSATSTGGPWHDVAALQPGAHTEAITGGQKFFRVLVP